MRARVSYTFSFDNAPTYSNKTKKSIGVRFHCSTRGGEIAKNDNDHASFVFILNFLAIIARWNLSLNAALPPLSVDEQIPVLGKRPCSRNARDRDAKLLVAQKINLGRRSSSHDSLGHMGCIGRPMGFARRRGAPTAPFGSAADHNRYRRSAVRRPDGCGAGDLTNYVCLYKGRYAQVGFVFTFLLPLFAANAANYKI